ncbi:MAG: ATP-binding cassette domain-containing protein [Planctomycetes bacterium]|nr:ATP-binding cassette domain-containing protein [Planctomycetota bacterium]
MIVVHELLKRFRAADEKIVAVNNLSFSVAAGEVYGLLGPNGAGKTTTIRMIVGLLKADSGYAEVDGYRSSTEPDAVKSRLGLVSANDGVYPWLSVREMLLFFGDLYGVPHEVAVVRLEHLADTFGLQKILERRCANLSTGQKQRVILARGLIHDPPVMLLDEPTRGLDVIGSKVVFDYIALLRDQNKAVIVCTHRLDEAQRLCDRFGLLHAGQLWREGTIGELQAATGCDTLVDMFLGFLDEQGFSANSS